jgi:hypothetical protein
VFTAGLFSLKLGNRSALFDGCLGGGQSGDGDAAGGAAYVVQSDLVTSTLVDIGWTGTRRLPRV